MLKIVLHGIDCGYLDNILYDFNKGVLPFDDWNNYDFEGLTFSDITNIKKYYNLTLRYGIESVYYLKLCYIIHDIIKNNNNNFVGFQHGYFKFEGVYLK